MGLGLRTHCVSDECSLEHLPAKAETHDGPEKYSRIGKNEIGFQPLITATIAQAVGKYFISDAYCCRLQPFRAIHIVYLSAGSRGELFSSADKLCRDMLPAASRTDVDILPAV